MSTPGTDGSAGGVEAWIALGGNLDDRRAILEGAVAALAVLEGVELLEVSPWIETEPVGGPPGQGPYLNGVARVRTLRMAEDLLGAMQAIERRFGRRRSVPGAARTLDLDLLLFGEQRIERRDLVVPHPRMEERTFVLEPLARLAPDLRLPRSGRTVRDCLEALRR